MALIELTSLYKEYHNDDVVTPALNDINLKIELGEFVAIMGASGSGKTTLLNMIGCMDAPTKGSYYFDGQDMGNANEKIRASVRGKKISFVFQNFALIPEYTVGENVEIPLMKRKLTKKERQECVKNALKLASIPELANKKPMHISGGQKQRFAIARAVACGSEVILADEPTGALDSKTGFEIMQLFTELNQQGKTIVLITHDKKVASYAKRLISIEDGRIIKDEKM